MGLARGGPYEESQLRNLYNTCSASPRELARYAHRPDEYEAGAAQQEEAIQPDALRFALLSLDSDDSPDLIMRMELFPTSRSRCQKTITSPDALELLWDRHLKNATAGMEYFYNVFQGSSVTAPAAGGLFELRMHQLFRQGYSLKLFPLGRSQATSKDLDVDVYNDYTASHKEESPKVLHLTVSEEYPLDEGTKLQADRYYRPPKCFPTIDSLLLVHPTDEPSPILLMFQITRNKRSHDVKKSGLDKINKLKFPSNTRRYYVAVTPLGIEPRIEVPKGPFKKVGVFHHPVSNDTLFPRSTVGE